METRRTGQTHKAPGTQRLSNLTRVVCPQRIQLTNWHAARASEYYAFVTDLCLKTGAELQAAQEQANRLGNECAQLWRILSRHKARHGC